MLEGFSVLLFVVVLSFAIQRGLRAVYASRTRQRLVPPQQLPLVRLPQLRLPVSQTKYEKALPVTIDAIARSLYSGSGFVQAVREASDTHDDAVTQDLKVVLNEVEFGVAVTQAFDNWQQRVPYDSVRICVAAMVLANEIGVNAGAAMDAAAAAVRRRNNAAALAKTYATQARASAATLALLPLVVSGPVLLASSSARDFMLHNIVGIGILLLGLGFDLVGWFWMRSMVKRALA